jgi:hypothetical protein
VEQGASGDEGRHHGHDTGGGEVVIDRKRLEELKAPVTTREWFDAALTAVRSAQSWEELEGPWREWIEPKVKSMVNTAKLRYRTRGRKTGRLSAKMRENHRKIFEEIAQRATDLLNAYCVSHHIGVSGPRSPRPARSRNS